MIYRIYLITLILTIPVFSFGQIEITEETVQNIMLLSEQGKTDEAKHQIDSIRNNNPVKGEYYIVLLMTNIEINLKAFNLESIIKDNEEIIELGPQYEFDCQNQIALYKRLIGDFNGAVASYKRMIQLDSASEIVYTNMAAAYNDAGKFEDAIQILNSNPNTKHRTLEYFHYAVAYYKTNKIDLAKINIDKYLKTEPAEKDYDAYIIAAQIYLELHDKSKSCKFITKADNIIIASGLEKEVRSQSEKVRKYAIAVSTLKNIEEIKKLKGDLCK